VTPAIEAGITNHCLKAWKKMSAEPNERLNQGAISILRLLFFYGELSVPSISRLLGFNEGMVEHHRDELLRREMISRKSLRRDDKALLLLEPKGRSHLINLASF
jgi:hypothetical protein